MGEQARGSVADRIEQCKVRIDQLKAKGDDTTKLLVIFNKIDAAYKAGNVKEENLQEAVKKLENLLTVTEKIKERPRPKESETKESESKKGNGPAQVSLDMESEFEALMGMEAQIKSLGGDTSPVFHHIEALREAKINSNSGVFLSYRDILRPWFHEYLFNLKKKNVDERISTIKAFLQELTAWERSDLASPISGELDPLIPIVERASDDIDMIIADLDNIEGMVMGARSQLEGDLRSRLEKETEELRSYLVVKGAIVDVNVLKSIIKSASAKANEGRYSEALSEIRSELRRIKTGLNKEKLDQLNKYLSLLDPIIERVKESTGAGSAVYNDLISKKESIAKRPIEHIEESLTDVGVLLDEAAKASAESEERTIREMKDRIAEIERSLQSIGGPEAQAISNIVQKVNDNLVEGDLQGATKLKDRAESALKNLLDRRERTTMEATIKALEGSLSMMRDKGSDVDTLLQGLDVARGLLKGGSIEELRSHLREIEEGLDRISEAEARSMYQRLHADLLSLMDEDSGATKEAFMPELISAEGLAQSGRTKEALDAMESIIVRVKEDNTSRVIKERVTELEGMIAEAKSYGLDVRQIEETVKDTKSLLSSGSVEDALSLVARARSDLETQIRERNIKKIEREIDTLVLELRRLGASVDDPKETLNKAYSFSEEDRVEEALSLLNALKSDLEKKLKVRRVSSLMDGMAARIREARLLNIDIAGHKAALTKARVRYEAGDIAGALDDLSISHKDLEDIINKQKSMRSRMDAIRGSLIALESKVHRLSGRGVDITELVKSLDRAKGYIESNDEAAARSEMEDLDRSVSNLFRELPVMSIMEGRPATIHIPEGRPTSSIEKSSEDPGDIAQEIDAQEARRRLQMLLSRIGRAVQMGGAKAQSESRQDLERIKILITKRDYIAAYRIAIACMKRLGG